MSLLTRRRLLAVGIASAGALVLEDASILEPYQPQLVRVEIVLPRLPAAFDGFTIAQLSDFHYDYLSVIPLRAAIEMVNRLRPDMAVLTGDFVTVTDLEGFLDDSKAAAAAAEPCAIHLAKLETRVGSLAVLGNHDTDSDADWITDALQSHGIQVLRNRALPTEQAGARFWVAGVNSVLGGHPDFDLALREVPESEAVVLLVHEPDIADIVAARYPVDLQISGHSHGGQVWIPGIGAPWLPRFARKYPRGLYRVKTLMLYTNLGLGTIRVPLRLNCPPEVTLFTLRAPNAKG